MPKCLCCPNKTTPPGLCESCSDEERRLFLDHSAGNPGLSIEEKRGPALVQAKHHAFRAVEHTFRALELVRVSMFSILIRKESHPLKKAA